MRHEMAMTKNVRRFLIAVQSLNDRPPGLEGMGLLWGLPGEGKTTTLTYVVNQLNGVYVRANACWCVSAMLGEIAHELGLERKRLKAPMMNDIIKKLMEEPRPIFVDEADYLLRQNDMIDALRDIYDMVPGSAVVLVGMEEMAVKVRSNGRFARRITQWIEFSGIDLGDARVVADTICEVPVADDLLAHLHGLSRGNIGRMTVGLARIETFGRSAGYLDRPVDLSAWGERELFYDQPSFDRRRRRKK